MYKRYQIWPLVRNWNLQEWSHIPESIHPYLGQPVDEPSPIAMALNPYNRKDDPRINSGKPNPLRFKTQAEQFIGYSLNPYHRQ